MDSTLARMWLIQNYKTAETEGKTQRIFNSIKM